MNTCLKKKINTSSKKETTYFKKYTYTWKGFSSERTIIECISYTKGNMSKIGKIDLNAGLSRAKAIRFLMTCNFNSISLI